MDVYWMFFKLLVSTIVTFVEAAAVLLSPAIVHRAPEPRTSTPRLVRAAMRAPDSDVRTLITQLKSADPAERTRAACELGDMESAAAPAVNALIDLLADATKVDRRACDGRRRSSGDADDVTTPGERAAAALASIGPASFEPLNRAAQSREWFARANAVWALGALEDPRAVRTIVVALRDPEPRVRRNGAWALGVLDAKDAVVSLVESIKDADVETRANATWALGAIGDARAVDPLARAVHSDADAGVRAKAAWALGAIGDSRAVDALGRVLLSDADVEVRSNAAWALGAIGEPRAFDSLVAALKDPNVGVRRKAAWALGAIQP